MSGHMQRIGLMGGSFNPVHLGHLHLAREALRHGCADCVWLLPSGNPPHKHAGLANKMDRLRMTELAVEGETGITISREEIDREGVIYTVDTLRRLHETMPDTQFVYLIGADTLRVLHTWRSVDEVMKLCEFLAFMRPGEQQTQMDSLIARWQDRGAGMKLLHTYAPDISSTMIRERVRAGLSLCGLVPKAVEDYIRERGLYRAEGDDCEA